MVDTKTPGDKTLSMPSKTLTLKPRVETGTVRQSFSHGRSKQVVVEKRGKRRLPGEAAPAEAPAPEPVAKTAPAKPAPGGRAAAPAAPRSGSGVVLRTLTEDERSARASALADAKVREEEERRIAEEEAKRRASREGIEQAEREAAEARRNADDVRERSIASFRRRTQRLKGHAANEPKEKLIREVIIPEAITIQELANRMSERAVDVIRMLMKQGAMHKITDVIDADTAQLIAEELGHTVKRVAAP